MELQQNLPFRHDASFEALQQGLQQVALRYHKVFPIHELTCIVRCAGYDPSALTEWFGEYSVPPSARVSFSVGNGVIIDLRWNQLDDGLFRFGGATAYRMERMVSNGTSQNVQSL